MYKCYTDIKYRWCEKHQCEMDIHHYGSKSDDGVYLTCPECIREREEWEKSPEGVAYIEEQRRINKLLRLIQYWTPVLDIPDYKGDGVYEFKYTEEEREQRWFNIFKENGYI